MQGENGQQSLTEYYELDFEDLESKCGFTRIPLALLMGYADLPEEAKIMHMLLLSYAYGKDVCWPSSLTLSNDLGRSERTAFRHLASLEDYGLLSRDHKNIPFDISIKDRRKINKTLLEITPAEAENTIKKLDLIKDAKKGKGAVLFVFKNRKKMSGEATCNNVLLRCYHGLSAGSKISFIFLCYLATCGISINIPEMCYCLNKGESTVKRYLKELRLADLIENDSFKPEKGEKVQKGNVFVERKIHDFNPQEIATYLAKYSPQYLVGSKNDSLALSRGSINVSDLDNTQYLVGSKNDSCHKWGSFVSVEAVHFWQHNNNIEIYNEEYVNVNDIKNQKSSEARSPEQQELSFDQTGIEEIHEIEEHHSPNGASDIEDVHDDDNSEMENNDTPLANSYDHLELAKRWSMWGGKFNDSKSIAFYRKVAKSFFEQLGGYDQAEMVWADVKGKWLEGQISNPGRYFNGAIKNKAEELGVNMESSRRQIHDASEKPTEPTPPSPPQGALASRYISPKLTGPTPPPIDTQEPMFEYQDVYDEFQAMPISIQRKIEKKALERGTSLVPDSFIDQIKRGHNDPDTVLKYKKAVCWYILDTRAQKKTL